MLRAWDGSFGCDSAGAPLFVFTQHELAKRVFVPLLGKDIAGRFLSGRRAIPRLQRLLLDAGDPLRPDIERAAGKPLAAMAEAAFTAAVQRVAQRCGERPEQWRWGTIQHIRLATLLGEIPLLGRRFRSLEAPFPGDVYTVSPSVPAPMRGGLRAFVGATSRFICDLATPDEALFAHTSGPSSDIGSLAFGRDAVGVVVSLRVLPLGVVEGGGGAERGGAAGDRAAGNRDVSGGGATLPLPRTGARGSGVGWG